MRRSFKQKVGMHRYQLCHILHILIYAISFKLVVLYRKFTQLIISYTAGFIYYVNNIIILNLKQVAH